MKYVLYSCGEQPINKHILQMERHVQDTDVIGCVQQNIIMHSEHGYGQWFWSDADIRAIQRDGRKLLDPPQAQTSLRETRAAIARYWKAADRLLGGVKRRISAEQLGNRYDDYTQALRRVYAHFMTTTGQVTYAVETRLGQILRRRFPSQARQTFETITTPEKPDILYDELRDWRVVLRRPTSRTIIAHTRTYPILLANVFSEESARQWAERRLGEKSLAQVGHELRQSRVRRTAVQRKQKQIFSSLRSREAEQLAWFLREGARTRLLVKACWNGEAYYLLPFFQKIARLARVSVRDVYLFYTWHEISALLHKGKNISSRELKRRRQYYLVHFASPHIRLWSGGAALAVRKKLLDPSLPSQNVKTFPGMVASRGMVAGRVKVIRTDSPDQIARIAESLMGNQILVCGMTNPTMIVLLKKISGIITDEGGATCHAAVISREFGLPCLVGCKVATLLLKDGEPILLDAIHGKVKRITTRELRKFNQHFAQT